MTDGSNELKTRAINAALKAADPLDLSLERLDHEDAVAFGQPHKAASYVLTPAEFGKAPDYLGLFPSVDHDGVYVGRWPHQVALYVLTLEEIGREAAANLTHLNWIPDWASWNTSLIWIQASGSPFATPHIGRACSTANRLSAQLETGRGCLRKDFGKAAACLALMVRGEVLEPHEDLVGGPTFQLSDWLWEWLRSVARHLDRRPRMVASSHKDSAS